MQAAATTSASKFSGVLPALQPVVLMNHHLQPDWHVIEYQCSAPLDERVAIVQRPTSRRDTDEDASLRQAQVTIALPMRLNDNSIRWPVLIDGHVIETTLRDASAQLQIHDDWNLRLREHIETWWWQVDEHGITSTRGPAVLEVGDRANRSPATWTIAGQTCHVLSRSGLSWTVGEALKMVGAIANLRLNLSQVEPGRYHQPLIAPVNLAQPLGPILRELLEPAGLLLQRELFREGTRLTQWRAVRSIQSSRRVRMPRSDAHQPISRALRINTHGPAAGARLWSAIAPGWEMESTFILKPAWPTSLQGQAAENYSKNSPSFTERALVYRSWALNEDNRLPVPHDPHWPEFDASRFFGESIAPQTLRFGPCVTLDSLGRRLTPVIEFSIDSGASWSRYPGAILLLPDRAAIHIDDTELDAAYLSAAMSGAARVRITASLRSPNPVRVQQWVGNPFHGTQAPRIIDTGQAFRFRRVDKASIHRALIANGSFSSSAIDETPKMRAWLSRQICSAEMRMPEDTGHATLALSGIWPLLRTGDVVLDGSRTGPDQRESMRALLPVESWIERINCNWPTSVEGPARVPTTTVDLRFQHGSLP